MTHTYRVPCSIWSGVELPYPWSSLSNLSATEHPPAPTLELLHHSCLKWSIPHPTPLELSSCLQWSTTAPHPTSCFIILPWSGTPTPLEVLHHSSLKWPSPTHHCIIACIILACNGTTPCTHSYYHCPSGCPYCDKAIGSCGNIPFPGSGVSWCSAECWLGHLAITEYLQVICWAPPTDATLLSVVGWVTVSFIVNVKWILVYSISSLGVESFNGFFKA